MNVTDIIIANQMNKSALDPNKYTDRLNKVESDLADIPKELKLTGTKIQLQKSDGTVIGNGIEIPKGEQGIQGIKGDNGTSTMTILVKTQTEYNALPSTKLTDNILYLIRG